MTADALLHAARAYQQLAEASPPGELRQHAVEGLRRVRRAQRRQRALQIAAEVVDVVQGWADDNAGNLEPEIREGIRSWLSGVDVDHVALCVLGELEV